MDVSYLANLAVYGGNGNFLDRLRSRCSHLLLHLACLSGRIIMTKAVNRGKQLDRQVLVDKYIAIVRKTESIISRICFGYARTRQEFEDLRQDVLINLWQGIGKFKGECNESTWVYRVALNTCVSTLRTRSREISTVQIDSFFDLIDETDDRIEMIRELHERIACLSPTDKAIILLWLDEVSYDEISSMTGLPRNTVATRLRRAKEKLQLIKN